MHDLADLEARGVPSMVVATTEFIEAAEVQAKALGTDPVCIFIPHPVQDRTDDELRAMADQHLDAILAMLLKGN